jgi:hypothetical protein
MNGGTWDRTWGDGFITGHRGLPCRLFIGSPPALQAIHWFTSCPAGYSLVHLLPCRLFIFSPPAMLAILWFTSCPAGYSLVHLLPCRLFIGSPPALQAIHWWENVVDRARISRLDMHLFTDK